MSQRGGAQRPNGAAQGKICQFKLVLLGESAVGKSSLVLRFVKGQFHEYQESTIGGKYSAIICSEKRNGAWCHQIESRVESKYRPFIPYKLIRAKLRVSFYD